MKLLYFSMPLKLYFGDNRFSIPSVYSFRITWPLRGVRFSGYIPGVGTTTVFYRPKYIGVSVSP